MCLEFRVTLYRRQFNCWIVNHMLDTRIQPSISVTTDFSVTYLPKTFLLLSLVGRPALVVPNLLHFRMMEASVLPGTFRAAEVVFLPQVSASVRWCLWAAEQFFWPHGFSLWYALSAVTHLKVDQEKWRAPAAEIHMSSQRLHCWTMMIFFTQICMLKLYNRNLPT